MVTLTAVRGLAAAALVAVAAGADARISGYKENNDMDMIALSNKNGSATVSLRGAHIRSYRPAGMDHDLLFNPKVTSFDGTMHNHGGIPVCWP